MKYCGFTLWKWLTSVAGFLLIVAVIYPVFFPPELNPKKRRCENNLKQIGLAFHQYIQDNDERLPLIVGSKVPSPTMPYGWADALYPYLKNTMLLQCPSDEDDNLSASPIEIGYSDYWLNRKMSGFHLKRVKKPEQSILVGEGNGGSAIANARYSMSSLPISWKDDESSPVYRHLGRAHYVFLDGHVKALLPQQITHEPLANGKPTFAVR